MQRINFKRYCEQNNLSTSWYGLLGYHEKNQWTRKRVGDFACYLTAMIGLDQR